MAGSIAVVSICVIACMTVLPARALIPEDAGAPAAWAPAAGPSAALSAEASAFTIASGTIPRAYQTGVRTPNTPKVPPITWIGVANAAEYKAQVHAAAGALNLVPVNSVGTVDVSRARQMTFVNLGTQTIWVRPCQVHASFSAAEPVLAIVSDQITSIGAACQRIHRLDCTATCSWETK